MSNNAPDYVDNSVFPPQQIKSQDELTEQCRQSEVLIKAIEKCEKLEAENQQLKELLKECRDEINSYIDFFTKKPTFEVLMAKIDNAIGDKK